MILQAPIVLTFCADTHRMRKWISLHQSKQSFDDFLGFLTGVMDAALAAQNMVIAAESLGLGCCYMGTTWWSADKISEILALPACVFPCTSLVMGYPNENPEIRDRLPLDLIVHEESYALPDDAQFLQKHAAKEQATWDRYKTFPELMDKLKERGITKVTDFYTSDLKYPKSLHREKSEMLIAHLKKQQLF
ncbi:MAG: nitroreductase family protein [Deltaproteobacteria bacterium]|nr:nitroreductase family protein [Deltaproteobacteria bacterium]